MYGFGGNFSALEWADQFGFFKVNAADQAALIHSGHYTVDGHRIFLAEEKCPDLSSTSTRIHLDIRV